MISVRDLKDCLIIDRHDKRLSSIRVEAQNCKADFAVLLAQFGRCEDAIALCIGDE